MKFLKDNFSFVVWIPAILASIIVPIVWAYLFKPSDFWSIWAVVALMVTATFTVLVYVDIFFLPPRLGNLFTTGVNGAIGMLTLPGAALCVWLAVGLVGDSEPTILQHVGLLLLAFALIVGANAIIAYAKFDEEKKRRATPGELSKATSFIEESRLAFRYCDLPTVFGLAIIAVYALCLLDAVPGADNKHHVKAFIAGAVSFDLLISNFVYGLHVWPWCKGKRRQGTPARCGR